jgi:hypothetical protein
MYLRNLIAEINETHVGLGELVAMCQLAVTAHKALLIISPSGCGKSTAMKYVGLAYTDDVIKLISTSRAGLGKIADELTNSEKTIIVEDLSTTTTSYARETTMTALSAICYDHEINSVMGGEDGQYKIDNFHGSALIGIQPKLLKELLCSVVWETTIKDKVIRYYHLRRPIEPNLKYPTFMLKDDADISKVADFEPDKKDPLWLGLLRIGYTQFSRARAKEHIVDLLKANAALDSRIEVEQQDFEMLAALLKPLVFEVIAMTKLELEGELILDDNLLLLLTEYFSYGGQVSLTQIATDHQVTLQQCYRIMRSESVDWDEISKSPTGYRPSKTLLALLKKYNLEVKNEN